MISRACMVELCDSKAVSRGLCPKHYARLIRHGSTDPRESRAMKFIRGVVENPPPDRCVEWPYGTSYSGYARAKYKGINRSAARIALILYTGVPDDYPYHAAHGPCNSRICINPHPDHGLAWKTPLENAADKLRDGTNARGMKSGKAKMTDEQVLSIFNDPRPQIEIAAELGIHSAHISRIKNGKRWAWLTGAR